MVTFKKKCYKEKSLNSGTIKTYSNRARESLHPQTTLTAVKAPISTINLLLFHSKLTSALSVKRYLCSFQKVRPGTHFLKSFPQYPRGDFQHIPNSRVLINFITYYFICMSIRLHVCLCSMSVPSSSSEARREYQIPQMWSYSGSHVLGVGIRTWVLLSAEPAVQPLKSRFLASY